MSTPPVGGPTPSPKEPSTPNLPAIGKQIQSSCKEVTQLLRQAQNNPVLVDNGEFLKNFAAAISSLDSPSKQAKRIPS